MFLCIVIINNLYAIYNLFVQLTKNSVNSELILVMVNILNRVTLLANWVEDIDRKYDSESPVFNSMYTSMIIGIMKGVLFFLIFFLNQNLIRKRRNQRQDHINF